MVDAVPARKPTAPTTATTRTRTKRKTRMKQTGDRTGLDRGRRPRRKASEPVLRHAGGKARARRRIYGLRRERPVVDFDGPGRLARPHRDGPPGIRSRLPRRTPSTATPRTSPANRRSRAGLSRNARC